MQIHEAILNDEILEQMIRLSEDWAAENSCYGYRANDKTDIEGNRIFLAEDGGKVIGYLFGRVYQSEKMTIPGYWGKAVPIYGRSSEIRC